MPGARVSPQGANYLHAVIRLEPGDRLGPAPKLGSVTPSQALAQARSNLRVLRGVLPRGTIKATRILPVVLRPGRFGLEVDLRVSSLRRLATRVGDVIDGMQTGLVGDDRAVVAGLAIAVTDDRGRRLGSWQSVLSSSGSVLANPSLTVPDVLSPRGFYPNLTGGPPTYGSASG